MRRQKKLLSICLALTMATSIIFQDVSVIAKTKENTDDKMIIQYDFNDVSSTIIPDQTGNGKAGVIRNYQNGGSEIVDAEIYGEKKKALSLPGGADGGYLELPSGNTLVENNEVINSVTVSCWVNMEANSGYQRIWDLGNDTSSYMYLLTDGYNEGATGYATAITNGGWSKEQTVEKGVPLELNKWILTTVTFDGESGELSLYEDGKLIGRRENSNASLSDLGNTTQNYIGKGQFADSPTKMKIADFCMYNYAMSSEEVASLFNISDEERIIGDLNSINLGDVSAVKENIVLPTKGTSGATFTWNSDNEDIISSNGEVKRPISEIGDVVVKLTATASYNDVVKSKDFYLTVISLPSNEEIVKHDLDKIDLGKIDSITENLTLPTNGEWGSQISWISSDEKYLKNDGTIKRPEMGNEEVEVRLTATATVGEITSSRDFKIRILPQYYLPTIVDVDIVEVTTTKGQSPTLPSKVNVTYNNGEKDSLEARWPSYIEKELYNTIGTFEIEGTVIDSDAISKAIITVVEDSKYAPEVISSSFDLSNISLDGDNILTQNTERTIEYLKLLDSDRMLYNFRKTFGQDTKGVKPLGGWDEPTGLLRGHSTGHYMSALALAYASTGDEELKDKMDYMISEMRELQLLSEGNAADFQTKGTAQSSWSTDPNEWGYGFISAYSPDQFALLEQYTPYATIWAPYYTLHKLMAGYLDCYTYGGNEEALETAKDLGSWIYNRLSACTQEQREKMWSMYIAGEYGGMNESLSTLYKITDDDKYLEAAKMFDNKKFFDNLSANVDDISGRHANQHIPQIVGAIKEYEVTGDIYYYNVAENFWDIVIDRYAYSIGGVGRGEMFKEPYMLANNIDSDKNCETCAAYNMLKLTKDLYVYNPDDAKYMDYYERTLINQIIASQNQETYEDMHNGTTYMLPIGPGAKKGYGDDYDSFTCYHGTGMENHVKYQEASYYTSEDNNTLYVNLYMPTTLDWKEKGVIIKQENEFPSDTSKMTINGNGEFELKLRVPYWATNGFTVKVNGEEVINGADASSYVSIDRVWKDGDTVEVNMPYSIHLDKTHDKLDGKTVASVMYGPLVMVAKSSDKNFLELTLDPNLESLIKVVNVDENNIVSIESNNLNFVPMYSAYNFEYHTYFKINMLGTSDLPKVNKDLLQSKYEEVKDYNEKDYTEESFKEFKEALNNAKSILDNQYATQSEVDNALEYLIEKIDKLVKKPIKEVVNKSLLQSKYEEVKDYNEKDYTEESFKEFKEALNNAKSILDNQYATQSEVDNALEYLIEKIDKLVKKPIKEVVNKSLLQSKYEEVKDYNQKDYTEESFKEFKEALDNAKYVLKNENSTQNEVDSALNELNNKVSKLVKKSVINDNNSNTTDNNVLPGTGGRNSLLILLGAILIVGSGVFLMKTGRIKKLVNKDKK